MAFEEKKKKAIALMEEKKMWRSNYAPPLLRLFWKLGGKMPPPPFAPFWRNMLFFAAWFGCLWGVDVYKRQISNCALMFFDSRACEASGAVGNSWMLMAGLPFFRQYSSE